MLEHGEKSVYEGDLMAESNLIGKDIRGYIVSEKLGSGTFGTVYKVIKTNVGGKRSGYGEDT